MGIKSIVFNSLNFFNSLNSSNIRKLNNIIYMYALSAYSFITRFISKFS